MILFVKNKNVLTVTPKPACVGIKRVLLNYFIM